MSKTSKQKKTDEQLDFEIEFYEKLLESNPDFVDALIPLGEALTRRKRHEQGLDVDIRLSKLRKYDSTIWYNLACSFSLLNRVDDSIGAIKRSFKLGYDDFDHLQRDPDLTNLREDPRFRKWISAYLKKHAVSKH